MPITDPNERARRAIVRAIDNMTELVNIVVDDPGDQNPDPTAFQVEPDDLFDLTFSRVGITNETLISGFIVGLKTLLPQIKARIQELLKDLQPGVQIGLVFNVIRRELAKPLGGGPPPGGGGGRKGASSESSSKSSPSKKGAGKG
ncbi:MAG: hypothetical protein QOH49_1486 [Acidobacteriota bacterium]|jgi:hypothetical protein|nr:hypothetical protein [Acidobacteriota bacterium]